MVRTGLAVTGAALVLLGGAALTWGNPSGDGEPRLDGIGEVRSVDIASGSGDVQVRYQPGGRAEVQQREHRGWWGSSGGGEQYYTVNQGVLRLESDCGWNCSVDYVVTLPTPVPVTGGLGSGSLDVVGMSSVDTEVGSGSVRIREVQGAVKTHAGSGEIQLVEIGGNVDVETSSGDVDGRNIRAQDVRAHSSSGGVALELLTPRTVDADTSSGNVELTVPRGVYRVDANADSGEENIEVARDPSAQRQLTLSTSSGDITVKAA